MVWAWPKTSGINPLVVGSWGRLWGMEVWRSRAAKGAFIGFGDRLFVKQCKRFQCLRGLCGCISACRGDQPGSSFRDAEHIPTSTSLFVPPAPSMSPLSFGFPLISEDPDEIQPHT